tara:strand:+ start:6484 stop:7722 length:1239 start_codon:yes stop_codon:yes gene_type:complete
MKKLLLILSAYCAFSTLTMAQPISDSISLGIGYTNQSYYSLNSGESANIDNSNWDIAFDASGYGSSIRINGAIGTELYKYPNGDTSSWSTFDTVGMSNWFPVYDSDTSWGMGAFNKGATSSPMDLGWGVYSTITHHIIGDSLFMIKLTNGSYKKLQIVSLASGLFTFKYANLDGTNEINTSLAKADYINRNFGYYNLRSDTSIYREPSSSSWDLLFTKYVAELFPGTFYGVTGVLQNADVEVIEMTDIANVNTFSAYAGHNFESAINTVGYDWKSFNMATFSYNITDSLCYFIDDRDGNIWRLVLTGFSGSSTGGINFTKELISSINIHEEVTLNFGLYPNPANDIAHVVFTNNETTVIRILNLQGQTILEKHISQDGFMDFPIDVTSYHAGMYLISLQQGSQVTVQRLIIQ